MAIRFHMRLFAAFLCAASAFAAPDSLLLRIDSIEGDHAETGREGWIDVSAVSSGLVRDALDGPAAFSDLVIGKAVDSASPLFARAVATGAIFPEAVLELRRAGPDGPYVYFEYRLRDVMVRSLDLVGTLEDEAAESVGLHFARADWLYRSPGPDGIPRFTAGAYWDIPAQTGGILESDAPPDPLPSVRQVAHQAAVPGERLTVPLTIIDLPSEDHAFSVSVEADPARFPEVSLDGAGTAWTLRLTVSPLLSDVSAPVRVDLTDGEGTRSMSFLVVAGGDRTPYEGFLQAYFSQEQLDEDPRLSSPLHDASGDGLPIVMAFFFGLNPRESNAPPIRLQDGGYAAGGDGARVLRLSYERRVDEPNVYGRLWGSADLQSWFSLGRENPLYEETVRETDNPFFERVEAAVTTEDTEPIFLRFEVRVSGGE